MAGDDTACQQEMERVTPPPLCLVFLTLVSLALRFMCHSKSRGLGGGGRGGEGGGVNATPGTHKLVTCACLCIDMLTVYDPTKQLPSLLQPLNAKKYFDIAQGFVN